MRAVMLGVPGAGKGTQAQGLAAYLGVPHISTGAIFREAVQKGTELGRQARGYMDRGQLVPDEITVGMVEERLGREDCRTGFILDGFPRNLAQAKRLDAALEARETRLDVAIHLVVPEELAVQRITGRRVCVGCGATFSVEELRARPEAERERCPRCGERLGQRDDDREEVVRRRLAVYWADTRPVVEYYQERSILAEVSGTPGVSTVFESILAALRQRGLLGSSATRGRPGSAG